MAQSLAIIEKFRAPAGLYRPSNVRGNRWTKAAGLGEGGEVIIQLQEDAKKKSESENPKFIAVVRYQLRHGLDVINARILNGLPLFRINETSVAFKSASTNTRGFRVKTLFRLVFSNPNDTNEFFMWWSEKNGSIKKWYENEMSLKPVITKRKADRTGTSSGLTPKRKRPKNSQETPPSKGGRVEGKTKLQSPVKTKGDRRTPLSETTNANVIESTNNSGRIAEVQINYEDAPMSQKWTAAFELDDL